MFIFSDISTWTNTQNTPFLSYLNSQLFYDTVNHTLLLEILSAFGFCDSILSWFSSDLFKCSFSVSFGGSSSSVLRLSGGVSQGSILGPCSSPSTLSLGYLIHIYDFNNHDMIYRSTSYPSHSVQTKISICLSDISSLTSSHPLKLNLSKTELFIFPLKSSPLPLFKVTVDNITIVSVMQAWNLGLIFNLSLSLDPSIQAEVGESMCSMLVCFRNHTSTECINPQGRQALP